MKKILCTNILGESIEVSPDELEFRPSLYGVIIENDTILLVPHWDGWDFPGGGVHIGETFEETFEREVRKETGLTATIGEHLLTAQNFFLHPTSRKKFQSILMFFTHTRISGEISDSGFSEAEKGFAKKAEWVPVTEALMFKFMNRVDSPALIREAELRQKTR